MRYVGLLFLLTAIVVPAPAQNAAAVYAAAKRPHALVLTGDRYHAPGLAREYIAKALLEENIPATFIENVNALSAEALSTVDLLIILRDGMNWPDGFNKPPFIWMTDAQQQAIWDFVNRGGGFLALHNAQGKYPPGGLYYKLFGGDYNGHPKPYKFAVRVENPNHPITAGVHDFEVFDEQHTVKYYLDKEHLLLRSISPENLESPAGWWREQGKGRFVYLAPGHTQDALSNPMMQLLIRNSVNWLLKVT